ncbi:hypothetical protein ColLi_06325 [Colletotrichum liriopes]|uniref:Azaphilone pigments biosynthesis cluster protein L N-terminal domain-containing protein n=1 Tax=Colletotrichum liriopes TaxID=708192 RepID=A0AA37LT64_9PEZI|nr:hypothetical protein ColLi_06325 [Colletotrichum liriopes]
MADPLSITASVIAIVTAAIQSTKSLAEAVNRFKGRDKTLGRLQYELEDLGGILNKLQELIALETSVITLLKDPVARCNQLCKEFEMSMKEFDGKSKAGFRDWAKMEFMRGNINDFMDTLAGYKATISVGLGTITMQTSKVTQKVLEDYNEMIMDTIYNLNLHLQRIDEKLALLATKNTEETSAYDTTVDLKDERAVTEQCLRVCEDARSYLESLTDQERFLKQQSSPIAAADVQDQFEAEYLMRKTLDENRDNLSQTIGRLQERLESLTRNGTPQNELERTRLQEDLKTSKQCLEVCKVAYNEVAQKKIFRVGEVVADFDSDQVVITTLADLFDVKKASSTNRSAQWIGSVKEETAQKISADRYGSRFGTLAINEASATPKLSTSDYSPVNRSNAHRVVADGQSPGVESARRRPNPNEIRKRTTDADNGDGRMQKKDHD